MRIRIAIFTVAIMAASIVNAESMLLVSASQDDRVVRFAIDESTGRLMPSGAFDVPGGPAPMAISPEGKTLYVSLRGADRMASFRIESGTGDLTRMNEIDAGGSATFIATDRSGRFLISAYYAQGKVRVHQLEEDGSLGELLQTIETAENAHCVAVDRSNQFVFVPHTGAEAIFQFRFDAKTGMLTENPAGNLDTSSPHVQSEPRHLWFHPTADFAYVSMERGSTIGTFRFDPEQGTLSPITSPSDKEHEAPNFVSTVPSNATANNTTADIELTPDGRFAYVSNRGHDSIAGFRVDAQTGQVRPTDPPTTSTEKTPRSFNIHPSGKWMYVAGQGSGKLTGYRIGKDGSLTALETHSVGQNPSWVQVVPIPEG